MNNKPIGLYDSGVGGAAVLRTVQKLLPDEKYILFADLENAPYGEKTKEEILTLARAGVGLLTDEGAKAVVVACNTATSAAIEELREEYDIPIIGMEPAVKPASENLRDENIVVLATSATLSFMKFRKLYESVGGENIHPVECPGLSTIIEEEKSGSKKIREYLNNILSPYKREKISAVVIGCTHYSFIEKDIKEAAGCSLVFDGRYGTAKHLKRTLEKKDILGSNMLETRFIVSGPETENRRLLEEFMSRPLGLEE